MGGVVRRGGAAFARRRWVAAAFRTVGPWTGRLLALPFGSSTLRGLVAVARYVFGSILALRAAQKVGGVGICGAICGWVLRPLSSRSAICMCRNPCAC